MALPVTRAAAAAATTKAMKRRRRRRAGNPPATTTNTTGRSQEKKTSYSKQTHRRLDRLLEEIYYNYGEPGALQNTPEKLLKTAQSRLLEASFGSRPGRRPTRALSTLNLEFVKSFLSKQPSYTVHRRVQREQFPRRKILVSGQRQRLEADLLELRDLAEWNRGVKYALVLIDAFTRKVWAAPLKSKDSPTVTAAFKDLVKSDPDNLGGGGGGGGDDDDDDDDHILYLYTDSGREFTGSPFQSLMKSLGIKHLLGTAEEFHCPFVERVIRSLKEKIFQALTSDRSKNWVDLLSKIVATYNNTTHSALGNKLTPNEASDPKNYLQTLSLVYPADEIVGLKEGKSPPKYNYKKGDLVRIKKRHDSRLPQKGYLPTFTWEIFRIRERANTRPQDRFRGPPAYLLEDLEGEPIENAVFYEAELVRVHSEQLNAPTPIQEILKRRRRKDGVGGEEVLAWFHGQPKSKAKWIPVEQVIGGGTDTPP